MLLTGSASITRFNVRHRPSELDFDDARFTEIPPGSELRESKGFVPFEPGAEYQVGAARWAFRVRLDRLKPDPTAVKERLQGMIRAELDAGTAYVGTKRRKELRHLAEEELVVGTTPSSKIIEAVIDGDVLYVASTAKAYLGIVMLLLRQVGVIVELKTPWGDRGQEDLESDFVATNEPGESVWGCRFLRNLGDRELLIEPESGLVHLQTEETRVTITGAVRIDLHRYVEDGAEILGAKMLTGETSFRLDAKSFRISNLRLRVDAGRHEHWTELLDERLEKICAVWELLERKYDECCAARSCPHGRPSRGPSRGVELVGRELTTPEAEGALQELNSRWFAGVEGCLDPETRREIEASQRWLAFAVGWALKPSRKPGGGCMSGWSGNASRWPDLSLFSPEATEPIDDKERMEG